MTLREAGGRWGDKTQRWEWDYLLYSIHFLKKNFELNEFIPFLRK